MNFEQEFEQWQNEQKKNAFLQTIKDYDDKVFESMKRKGWMSNGFKSRTISFTFGTMTFERRCYIKADEYCVPVDEHFGFLKGQRISTELLIRIVKLAIEGTYASACRIIWELYHVDVSIWTVHRAVSDVAKLLEEREEYRYLEEEKLQEKLQVKQLYIEGDGVLLRTRHPKSLKRYWKDYSHFVVHTGVIENKKGRPECQNRMEFFGPDIKEVRQQLMDHIYNTMNFSEDTLLITNSDGGTGYTPDAFKGLARELGIKRHEHFWDRFHVKERVERMTRKLPEIGKILMESIYSHNRNQLKAGLDTFQSCLNDPNDEQFLEFKGHLLRNFIYTKLPEQRGLSRKGLGVMESNHRKITYRSKHRGMHWSRKNITAIGRLIILREAKLLDELFYGDWRETYEKYHEVDEEGWHKIVHSDYEPPSGYLWGSFKV